MGTLHTIDEYIQTFPDDTQKILEKIRRTIRGVIPDAKEAISYGIPAFKIKGLYVIYFAGWKDHIGIYPIPPKGDEAFQKQIAPFRTGKGTLQFPLDKPVPYDLIKKITRLHLEEKGLL